MKTALLIERDAVTRRSLELALALRGYLSKTAASTYNLRELAQGHAFDLVVAGQTTAGEPTADVCRAVRSVPDLSETPLIALEGHEGSGAIAGANGSLTRPIDLTQLDVLLDDLERGRASPEALTGAAAAPGGPADGALNRYRVLVERAPGVILIVDADGTIDWANSAAQRILGHDPDQLRGRNFLTLCHPDDAGAVSRMLVATTGARGAVVRDVRFMRQDGATIDLELSVENLRDDPAVGGIVLLGYDVSERVQRERALRDQALHDALTGLPTRLLFVEQAERTLARAERRNEPVVMVFIDLDDLQEMNQRLGSAVVDDLLRAVAGRLHRSLRANDTTSRFGDDEFAILLDDLSSESDVAIVAERLLEQLARPFEIADDDGATSIVVTGSMGVAVSRPGEAAALGEESRLGDLLRRADAALSRAKMSGKARWVHADDLGRSYPAMRDA